jgi:RNA polymerase sigma factor (sigma-70 family)
MSTLNADERALFDRGYKQCERRALRAARKRGVEDAPEILQAAMCHVIESVTRQQEPRPMPASEREFSKEFLHAVRYIAMATVRGNTRYTAPVHTHWGAAPAPVSRRKVPERLLCQDFEDIDEHEGEAAGDDDSIGDEPLPLPKHRGPCWPKIDRDQMQAELERILALVMAQLSGMQREVVELQLAGVSRDECARRLGISVKTFDIHWSRARKRMRLLLMQGVWRFPDLGFADNREWASDWNAIFFQRYIRQSGRKTASINKRHAVWLADVRARKAA